MAIGAVRYSPDTLMARWKANWIQSADPADVSRDGTAIFPEWLSSQRGLPVVTSIAAGTTPSKYRFLVSEVHALPLRRISLSWWGLALDAQTPGRGMAVGALTAGRAVVEWMCITLYRYKAQCSYIT